MFLFSPHVGQLTKEGRSCYMTGDLEHCQSLLHIVPQTHYSTHTLTFPPTCLLSYNSDILGAKQQMCLDYLILIPVAPTALA